ncbi:hypothetical protein [Capnocytophaga stomatis]|uniref:hypothetical protein n=1 Tax=Capnocytophaga stomatis TaxID=1848904 RepID=UPI001AD018B1|nr:hypothetical protein [Capnocytophaga stomatis]GIM49438.1 hypothetical protein CAPN003_08900 [Capnocytophaga stomatis]
MFATNSPKFNCFNLVSISGYALTITAYAVNIQGYQIPVDCYTTRCAIGFGESGGDSLSYIYLRTNNFHSQMPKPMKITRGVKHSSTKSTLTESEISAIQNSHKENRENLIKGLYNRSIQQLINDFIIEMDAKNKAYYFILESGLFNEFSNYCKKK